MPNAAPSADARGWLRPAGAIVVAVTLARVALLAFNRTDLFVDEAQYWLWGQNLALGYYSKPPLIGWTIRAVTELGGSDSPFWVRLAAPLFHGATALILGAIAAPRAGHRAAIWVSATWITLPMVSLGSLLISTDTVMVPFLALALLAWLKGLDVGGSHRWAALAGVALGLAFLGKYAAIYYLLCAALAAALTWHARPGWGPAITGLGLFLLTISPNVAWNLGNGLSTLAHTLDNADWVRDPGTRAQLNLSGLAGFLAAQFAVFGPVLFAGLLVLAARPRQLAAEGRLLLLFSLPILVIVSAQALLSAAYANWAATAYVAGTLLVVPWLLERHVNWLRASLALHLAIALLLPLLTILGTGLRAGPEGQLLLERYLGRREMTAEILQAAAAAGLDTVVADDRDVLADLFYNRRDDTVAVFARPVNGRAPNHYVLKHSMPRDLAGPVLLVTRQDDQPNECTGETLGRIAPATGAYAERSQKLFRVEAQCLVGRSSP
ncbi:glycosyltransferase family 39 protein [Tropicimonas sp. IMCC6043]|uniref:ArnT family glycosyltransferase n=1 Tax=Tropicimonas sp. IMCC6043 TaxID=2510645 RepID=UPI0013EB3D10|nr:glycosyltransferase family 39 protein [Tropicimonas sp. IMCC6043]